MPNDKEAFFHACIFNGLIVDANLFLLLAFETSHKRTNGMDEELIITRRIASCCSERGAKLILTPHIVAEVSNMIINRGKKFNFSGDANFIKLTGFLREAQEHSVEKELILENTHLSYVGFTDLSILEAAKKKNYGVLTVDNELFCRLVDEGRQAVNPRVIANAKTLQVLVP
jgi:hypothetical protein